MAQANAVFRMPPSNADSLPWGSYIVDLTRPETAIFDSFDSAHKNRIRKAIREQVVISAITDVDKIYDNIRETMERQNMLFFPSRSYLVELQRRLGPGIDFYIAEQGNKLQGCAVVVHNHLGAFYYYGGSVSEPSPGSLTMMQYEIIKDLKKKNVPVYDLMGARLTSGNDPKIEGIQRFKRRFSSGLRAGYCFRSILSPLRHQLMVGAVKTYFLLKGSHYSGDVFDQTRRNVTQQNGEPVTDGANR
jgi:lipid II:glycine glycyltransferase (peptidoglycan interpeptide bridge formation enzyme)